MSANRNVYLDVVRGFGVILVMFGHVTMQGQLLREWIYGFHMPLFFMLSGVFARTDGSFRIFLRKKLRTLYVPFAFFLTIDKIGFLCGALMRGERLRTALWTTLPSPLAYVGVAFKTKNSPIWFLFVLLVLQIALFFLSKKPAILYAAVFLSGILTVPLWFYPIPVCVLVLNAVPAFFFFALGYLFRGQICAFQPQTLFRKSSIPIWLAAAAIAPGYALCCARNGNVDMIFHYYGNSPILFFCCAGAGIVLMLLGCSVLYTCGSLRKALVWFGQNSLIVLVTHYYLVRIIFPALLRGTGLLESRWELWVECVLMAIMLLCMVPTVWISRRWLYLPLGLPKPEQKKP